MLILVNKYFDLNKIFLAILVLTIISHAQWSSNPSVNTNLLIEANNPVNIVSVGSSSGGTFIFWQDTRNGNSSDIYFQYLNISGRRNFTDGGKILSNSLFNKEKPVIDNNIHSYSTCLWKEISLNGKSKLFIQRINENGDLLWGEKGIELTSEKKEILSYAITSDKSGYSFIVFIEKTETSSAGFKINLQKISPAGYIEFKDEGTTINSSATFKNMVNILSDDNGGAYIFWMEVESKINNLHCIYADGKGNLVWGKKVLDISGNNINVVNYKVLKVNSNTFYVNWTNQGKNKFIYHQLFNSNAIKLWSSNEKVTAAYKGNQFNPNAVLTSDSSIFLSWTQEIGKGKNVVLQKYKLNGDTFWKENVAPTIEKKGDHFSQTLIADKKGGAIVAWFNKKNKNEKPNIFCQRIDKKGAIIWDSVGVALANNFNTEKSYLSLQPDLSNGVIAIFKEKRNNINSIYAHRIFANKTFVAQMINFNAVVSGDSVKLSWQTLNENDFYRYRIQRLISKSIYDTVWSEIVSLVSEAPSKLNSYQFFDQPNETGTIYYRVIQTDRARNIQASDIIRINFEGKNDNNFFVYQNMPNPFSDSTIINYYLPEHATVKFEFYNARVEKINEVEIDDSRIGRNKIVFYSNDLPEGIYFYRFIASDFVDVKKMVIEK